MVLRQFITGGSTFVRLANHNAFSYKSIKKSVCPYSSEIKKGNEKDQDSIAN